MKIKNFPKMSTAIIMAVMLVFGASSMTAFAEELPTDIPTPDKAAVSLETDKATNEDPEMGTKFYMYIPPDVVPNDYPQMGDEGVPVQWFLAGAVVSGVFYLGVTAYATHDEEKEIVT